MTLLAHLRLGNRPSVMLSDHDFSSPEGDETLVIEWLDREYRRLLSTEQHLADIRSNIDELFGAVDALLKRLDQRP